MNRDLVQLQNFQKISDYVCVLYCRLGDEGL